MKMKLIWTLVSLVSPLAGYAQELHLFEQPEGAVAQPVPVGPEQVFTQGNGQPAFTLRSISRFGDRYEAVLVNRAGATTEVSWRVGEQAPVANTGFTVVAAGPGALSLTHPGGDSCMAAPALGVACAGGDRSELRLVPPAPLASNGNAPVPMGPQAGFSTPADPLGINAATAAAAAMQSGVVDGQQVFINPFSGEPEVVPQIPEQERVARQQRQELRAARLRQFEQGAQIPDAAVPPNMERVRTPFGDRLIPRRE